MGIFFEPFTEIAKELSHFNQRRPKNDFWAIFYSNADAKRNILGTSEFLIKLLIRQMKSGEHLHGDDDFRKKKLSSSVGDPRFDFLKRLLSLLRLSFSSLIFLPNDN